MLPRMSNRSNARLGNGPAVIPFLVGAVLFDVLGYFIMVKSPAPLTQWVTGAVIICVGTGAWLSILPFWWDAKANLRMDEVDTLAVSTRQIQNIQKVADQITTATAQWMTVQEHSSAAVDSAKKISEEMGAEAIRFAEFMKQANDREKAALRLETEKLKRAEADWLQILVRILDHIHALHQAGLRSGQKNVVEQLTHFQNACRDVARRVGLVGFGANPGDAFDEALHQPVEPGQEAGEGARVQDTIALGYTFQGQQIRRAAVTLASETEAGQPADEENGELKLG